MTKPDAQHTGVILPPPVIYLLAVVVMIALDWQWPLPIAEPSVGLWTGSALLALGVILNLSGALTLRRSETAIHPNHAADHLVTHGPFRFSRNPLYIGLNLVFVGLTLMLNSYWGLLLLAVVLPVMHYGVIRREETHLQARFGETFERYRARVRRYL